MSPTLPTGTITFLFTDIEGSTPLWEREPQAMRPAGEQHDAILRQAVEAHHGHLYKTIGDAIQAAFALPADALAAALQAQRGLAAAAWPTSAPLRVRMGLHAGEAEAAGPAESAGPDYTTTHTLNRVARILSAAHGGQIILSAEVAGLLRASLPAEVSLRDLGQHRLKGLAQREHLFQVLAPDLPADFPPLRSLDASAHNLPVQLTHFIGREREIAELRRLLSDTALLTLTGSGGTGKTRLTLQVAAEALPSFPDGAWLVELAPVTDPALVLQTIASTLDARQQPGRPLFDVLSDFLRSKQLLLILDNCEHLIAACADVAERLLRQCSRLKIIASSREALGVAGETTYPVPSLSLPQAAAPATGAPTVAALSQSEAVRLFVDRAQAALPSFALTGENAPAVAVICRRLDGIPLALELAAARIRLLGVDQIAARLDDRFRLLTGGSRTALPRQQTLRALIDWSYALLTEPERACLQQLSVFAGGWTLEAAEAVCNGENETAGEQRSSGAGENNQFPPAPVHPSSPAVSPDVLELLSQLANKSLVVVERDGDETRYRLLETIRQYVREKLFESGNPTRLRDGHLGYFLRYAEQGAPELLGPRMVTWLNRFERDHDNFRAALEWALDTDPQAALKLADALVPFWARRGYVTEGLGWLAPALARAEAATPAGPEAARPYQVARARGLGQRAWLDLGMMTNVQAARAAAEASVQLARQLDDHPTLGRSLAALSMTSAFSGDPAQARAAAEEALAVSRERDDTWGMSVGLGALILVDVLLTDNLGEARVLLGEAMRLARQRGNPWYLAQTAQTAARLAVAEGDLAQARAHFEGSARLFADVGDLHQMNGGRSDLAHALRRHGQMDEALALYRETLRAWQHLGHRGAVAHQLESLAFIAIARQQPVRAARLLGAAERLREASGAVMLPPEPAEYDQALAALRAQLSKPELEAAWAAGRVMPMEDAIEFALGEELKQ